MLTDIMLLSVGSHSYVTRTRNVQNLAAQNSEITQKKKNTNFWAFSSYPFLRSILEKERRTEKTANFL